jgi:hypothetical protein
MSTPVRSEGWTVRPSFVPHGAVAPVTLLMDDEALTQLAGDPSVAWQTPWSELSNIQIVRFTRSLALFATAAGVRYCWRNPSRADFEALRTIVVAHGGVVARHRRRAGLYSVAVIVLIAALAGAIGSWIFHSSSAASEIAAARHVNLTLKDLPTGWFVAPSLDATPLTDGFPTPGSVDNLTKPTKKTKTAPVLTTIFANFADCLGVTPAHDRVYGAAGQQPDYQVTSRVFASTSFGGIEALTTTQYYRTTSMVHRDTVEMSKKNFGSCFVTSNVAIDRALNSVKLPTSNVGVNFRPATFLRGWSRGGEAVLTLPNAGSSHLVLVEVTSGHYEVTLGVLVDKWPSSETFVSNLTSTVLSRMVSSTSKSV